MTSPPPFSPTVALLAIGKAWEARYADALRPLGLTSRRHGLLGHIKAQPGISFSELARRSKITVQSAHSAVADLVAAGFVDDTTAHAGSASTLAVTRAGLTVLAEAAMVVKSLDAELVGTYPSLAEGLEASMVGIRFD